MMKWLLMTWSSEMDNITAYHLGLTEEKVDELINIIGQIKYKVFNCLHLAQGSDITVDDSLISDNAGQALDSILNWAKDIKDKVHDKINNDIYKN
jgi:hypothetical protein